MWPSTSRIRSSSRHESADWAPWRLAAWLTWLLVLLTPAGGLWAEPAAWRIQLPPVMEQRGPVIELPRLAFDTPAATELAELSLMHLVLGALPPAARTASAPAGGVLGLPADAGIEGNASLALSRGSPARLWQGRVLSLGFEGEGCGAYCESYSLHTAFDTRSGRLLAAQELLTPAGLRAITRRVDAAEAQRLRTTLAALRRASQAKALPRDDADTLDAQLAMYEECQARLTGPDRLPAEPPDPGTLRVTEGQLVFGRGRCSNHAARAIDDLGDFDHAVPLAELAPHWSPYGRALALGEGRAEPPLLHATLQVFRGRIDGRIPVTLFLQLAPVRAFDPPLAGTLYYDKVGSPIMLKMEALPGQPDRWNVTEQTRAARPGRLALQLDRSTGRLVGDWRQDGKAPLAFEATALTGR